MNEIGVREAKAQLSRLLRDVKRGRTWTITERGVPVARLQPVRESETREQQLKRLEEAGVLVPIARKRRTLPRPVAVERGLAQRFLEEDRSGR